MYRRAITLIAVLVLFVTACNLPRPVVPGTAPTVSPAVDQTPTEGAASGVSTVKLPDLLTRFPPPPILAVPRSTVQVGGESFDAYQVPGDRFRVLCKQPCPLEERLIAANYVAYKVTMQRDVRTAGFDILDKMAPFDIHLNMDNECTRPTGEWGSTGSYADDPDSLVICLYLTEPDLQADTGVPFTPEGAIRSGGLGVFAHEYAHALLWGRFSSSHDFVFPIEYMTNNPSNPEYADLCSPVYQDNAPLSYQLCKSYSFTFDQLIQSLLDVDRLYQGGYGNLQNKLVGYNQYRAILDNILGRSTLQAFTDAGYQKIFVEEGTADYTLPYASEACTFRAGLAGDGAVRLGTMLDVKAPFVKTWQIRNTGSCSWDGVRLVFVRGEAMTAATSAPVPAAAPGTSVEVSVPMTAPAEAGVHTGEWRLRSASGQDFGPIFNLVVYTRPGCAIPPQLSSFTASPATLAPGGLSLLSWGQVTNVDRVEIAGIGDVDPNGNRLLVQPQQTTSFTLQAACGTNEVTAQAAVTVDPGLPPFAITGLTVSADPARFSGSCSQRVEIKFTAELVSTGPGAVLVRWDANDGSTSDPRLVTFDQAGSQKITVSRYAFSSRSGWMALKILAPQEQAPVQAEFTLTCTP